MADAVTVEGIDKLMVSCKTFDKQLLTRMRGELGVVAQPVRERAEQLVGSRISGMLSQTAVVDWWKMRVGFTPHSVYVAPAQRGSGGSKRPNLAGLLMNRALNPALDDSKPEILVGLERLLDELAAAF